MFVAMLIGLFALFFSLPVLDAMAHGKAMGPGVQKLLHGMAGISGLFAAFGMITGFLGLFHFGRRRGNALLGLILSAGMILGVGAFGKHLKQEFKDHKSLEVLPAIQNTSLDELTETGIDADEFTRSTESQEGQDHEEDF